MVGWLGNPAWWRETLPRLAHYYTLNVDRKHSLPNIQIIYFGQIYEFSLPWHNAWVLIGHHRARRDSGAAAIGLVWAIGAGPPRPAAVLLRRSLLDLAGDPDVPDAGARRRAAVLADLFLPGGVRGLGNDCGGRPRWRGWFGSRLASLGWSSPPSVLGSAAFALYRIHPYELSYYNELVGGPRGAWERGFELTYWYDAFTDPVIDDLNHKLPPNTEIDFFNDLTAGSVIVFQDLQTLGKLRGDIYLAARAPDQFPFVWLLTQDSKAQAFTRLLFAMHPWYSSRPRQLAGAQVAAVADPVAVSRAYALRALLEARDQSPPPPPAAPRWVRENVPWLARLWGDGLVRPKRTALNQQVLDWSRDDPEGLLAAARLVAAKRPNEQDKNAQRLMDLLTVESKGGVNNYLTGQLLKRRPRALVEAVQILNSHRDEVVTVMSRSGYADPQSTGGYLDRDLPASP